MIHAYLASVPVVTAAGVAAFSFVARTPRTLAEMVQELDEGLLERVAWMVRGPKRTEVRSFEIMEAIGGRRGFAHLLSQARLMTGIVAEARKYGTDREAVEKMCASRRELWLAVLACLFWPSRYAERLAYKITEMAEALEDVLISIDAVETPAF